MGSALGDHRISRFRDSLESATLVLGGIALFVLVLGDKVPILDEKWRVITENIQFFLGGLWTSWVVSVSTFISGFAVALLLALSRRSTLIPLRLVGVFVIELSRVTPALMLIFWTFFALPLLMRRSTPPMAAAAVSMTLIAAGYLAEVVRAGFNSVPRGQLEAGISCGLSQTNIWIIYPQAFRNMLPAIVSQFVMHFKTTSFLYIIGIQELFWSAVVVNNREFASVPIFTFVAAAYFVCSLLVSWVGNKCLRALSRDRDTGALYQGRAEVAVGRTRVRTHTGAGDGTGG
jgi:His/Glu/Gln/Arg/opine family amino acid ABC transporter permease subunit